MASLQSASSSGRLGLLVDVGMAAVVIALEIGGRGLAAQIAVDALIIDVEFSRLRFRRIYLQRQP